MTTSIKQSAIIFAISQIFAIFSLNSWAQQDRLSTDRATRVGALSGQLHWHDEAGRKRYEAVKDQVTQTLLSEIDGYIGESFDPRSATAEQVQKGVDAFLGYREGGLFNNIVFLADLPDGHFLIIGIEIWRGGSVNGEDAISFRAYANSGGKFVHVASVNDLTDSGVASLFAKALPTPPVAGQFWFIAWADVPPLAPFKVAMRLYAFDGKDFRTAWNPENVIASSVPDAVQTASGGFIVNRMPDFQSQLILHEQYSVSADGPKKIVEWTTQRE